MKRSFSFEVLATITWLNLAVVFAVMWKWDTITVCEDILPVRIGELAVFSLLTTWGVYRLVKGIILRGAK